MPKATKEEIDYIIDNYQLKTINEIANKLKRSKSFVNLNKKKLNLKSGIKYRVGVNRQFFKEPNLLNCYWAGFIAADGYIRYLKDPSYQLGILLSTKDEDQLIRFKQDIEYTGKIYHRIKKRSILGRPAKIYKSSQIVIVSKEICLDLFDNFNITPQKTFSLKPPLLNNQDQIFAFIAGYIDGDGTIRINKNKYLELSIVGSEFIIKWIQSQLDKCFPSKKKVSQARFRKDRKNHWVYKIVGSRAKTILEYMNQIDITKMPRKWQIINQVTL